MPPVLRSPEDTKKAARRTAPFSAARREASGKNWMRSGSVYAFSQSMRERMYGLTRTLMGARRIPCSASSAAAKVVRESRRLAGRALRLARERARKPTA